MALALSGCATTANDGMTTNGAAAETDPESFITFTGGLLTYEQKVNADGSYITPMAQFTGTLSFENGCVLVGGKPHVSPADGTSWDGTTLTVKGKEFVVGDELVGGSGGASDGTNLPDEALASCGDSVAFIVTGVDPRN
ncbi:MULTISPECIES: hypothetical protein [Cryobacterium]|uniref:hypothetical protein n=1 Tax=Cryobacterium TaxID=69578 RepID=UPI0010572B1B|nr:MULTISPECIES: hypothetical protein [Cryobacterium]TFC47788.1 hypothetical protein E3O57_02285 [Cryobacterium sp. TMN-39-2]